MTEIKIYQIDGKKDVDRVKFIGFRSLWKFQKNNEINSSIYEKTYEGKVECKDLEEIYEKFNLSKPEDFKGHSLSVSDVVEIVKSDYIKSGFYFCDSIGFKEINFKNEQIGGDIKINVNEIKEKFPHGTKIELINMKGEMKMPKGLKGEVKMVDDIGQIHMQWENGSSLALNIQEDNFKKLEEKNKISVLLIEPGQYPKLVDIEENLEVMQKIVGGYIEEYMPFEDEVAIVCNEEGKMMGLDLNRAIYDEDNKIADIIAGKFFICSAPLESEKFESLPKDLAEKYMEKFKYPEKFYKDFNGDIVVKQVKPKSKYLER